MKIILKKIIIYVLTSIARCSLYIHRPKIICITGNVGKTGTKDAVYEILKPHVHARKTMKSFNSDIGIPLSIVGQENGWNNLFRWLKIILNSLYTLADRTFPKFLVLEVGADHKGDISRPASWLRPTYSIFTRFPEVPVHVEFFSSKEEVIQEKESLAKFTKKDGVLILNHDDHRVLSMKDRFPQKIYTYGEDTSATIQLSNFVVQKKEDMFFATGTIIYNESQIDFTLPRIIAKTQVLQTLPGILILCNEGYSFKDAVLGLNQISPTNGRLSVLKGINGSVLLDDTYNSSPAAVENAISVLISLPERKRTIAVLGDMMELGMYTEEEHRKIGQFVALKVDIVVCVGVRSKFTYEEALRSNTKEARWFETSTQAGQYMKSILKEGDVVLFKGSQSPRIEKALKECLLDTIDAERFLVRQEKEWLDR